MMYEKLFAKKNQLIEDYESAQDEGDTFRMSRILEELEEVEMELKTEFF